MSNSKKNWNNAKSAKRTADLNKKVIKVVAAERKVIGKRVAKGIRPVK